jgi:hypothetical protein
MKVESMIHLLFPAFAIFYCIQAVRISGWYWIPTAFFTGLVALRWWNGRPRRTRNDAG